MNRAFTSIGLATLALAATAVAATAGAQQGEGPPAPIVMVIEVGQSASICPCPVSNVICDDASLVEIVSSETDVRLKGVRPGKTLCSARNILGIRQFFDVTVVPKPAG
jgi:hypothetical protein